MLETVMSPKGMKSRRTVEAPSKPAYPSFPKLSTKYELPCTILEADQIVLIDDLFSAEECKAFVAFIETLPLEVTPPKKRGEADRVNHRLSVRSAAFADHLFTILKPHLPVLPTPPSVKVRPGISTDPHSLNSNIRLYRYSVGEHFGQHYDDSVKDPGTGAQSEWTLLIPQWRGPGCSWRTGLEKQTVFYRETRGKGREEIAVPLTRGTALLHRHGHECMLHEGKPVLHGMKYVLRSDVMFKR